MENTSRRWQVWKQNELPHCCDDTDRLTYFLPIMLLLQQRPKIVRWVVDGFVLWITPDILGLALLDSLWMNQSIHSSIHPSFETIQFDSYECFLQTTWIISVFQKACVARIDSCSRFVTSCFAVLYGIESKHYLEFRQPNLPEFCFVRFETNQLIPFQFQSIWVTHCKIHSIYDFSRLH